MKCKVCGNKSNKIFDKKILNKYTVNYFYCSNCGFIQTEDPYWIGEAYEDAITSVDTGIMLRTIQNIDMSSSIICNLFDRERTFLDYGGGYGIFTRIMRDRGFDFYWHDLYCKNIFSKEFEYNKQSVELLTCFEVFEHFTNPIVEMENMLSISNNILFSTELYGEEVPNHNEWWYYCFETGQHISFFSKKTLKYISNKYNLNLYSNSNIHLMTSKNIEHSKFDEIISNYKSDHNSKYEIISRTLSDMNYVMLKNNKIEYINKLNYGFYNFISLAKDKNVIVFGTGSFAEKIIELLSHRDIAIQYLSDNNSDKWGKIEFGIEIIEPEKLKFLDNNTLILIGSSYYIDISRQLDNMGIKEVYYITDI